MIVGKVIGEVVSSCKTENLTGAKFLVVEVLSLLGKSGKSMIETGSTIVANDAVGVGRGEVVLCVQGSSARFTEFTSTLPTDACIIGIIDSISVKDKTLYSKSEE